MSKQVSEPFQNIAPVANNMTGTSVINSTISNIVKRDTVGIHLSWAGSPTGTFQVLVSNDYKPQLTQTEGFGAPNSGTWVPVPITNPLTGLTALTVPTSLGSPIMLNLNQLGAAWIYVAYTNSAGTGTLTSTITAKSLG
jgi:hypothetical protein